MKVFRPGASLGPLLAWTLIAVALGFWSESHAQALPPDDSSRWPFHLFFAASLVLGPLTFLAHALRRLRVSVTLSGINGLVLNGRTPIPWRMVRSVERRPGAFRQTYILQGFADPDGAGALANCLGPAAIPVLVILTLLALLYFSLLPALSLLSPWHPRVTVTLADGQRLVYRDLEDDEEFVRRVERGMDRRALLH
jgi:hypothetical protein